MRPFELLSARARFARLRRLALAALPSWELQVQRVDPLTYWENATFRVRAVEGDFLLRVHRPGHRSHAQVLGELSWLRALRAHGIEVQRPIGGVVEASAPGVPEARLCTLLTWCAGRLHHRAPRPVHFRAGGRLQGRLHGFAQGFREPLVPRLAGLCERAQVDEGAVSG